MSEWFGSYGWGEVAPSLFTGSYPQDAHDVATLGTAGINTVVNLCRDEEYRPGVRVEVERAYAAAALTARDGVDPATALASIRARREEACPLPHQERDLRAWWNRR